MKHFPIKSAADVTSLLDDQLDANQPDLSILSLVLGLVEHQFTASYSPLEESRDIDGHTQLDQLPLFDADEPLPYEIPAPKQLIDQFRTYIRGAIDLSQFDLHREECQLVERVADAVWNYLAPSLRDGRSQADGSAHSASQAHLQFLSSFLLERKLDSFGLTCAVIAGLQTLLPYHNDYFLTLSEDHSRISVRPNDDTVLSEEKFLHRVEVTWHGKEDMRSRNPSFWLQRPAQPPDNWLYLKGRAVVCRTPAMTVAALVSALNPSVTLSQESLPLAKLQRDLLLILYRRGALSKYPMALGNLADLVELLPTGKPANHDTPTPLALYNEAVASAMAHYEDHHVYPYAYLAGFHFRSLKFGTALRAWRNASRVIARFNYIACDDEEAYKEFQGIATDLIPYSLKRLEAEGALTTEHYRDLLEYYDGLRSWEQSSRFPLLHIGWAKSFISCLNKFPAHLRTALQVSEETSDDEMDDEQATSSKKVKSSNKQEKNGLTQNEVQKIAERCSEELLNPAFLLGQSDQPMLDSPKKGEKIVQSVTVPKISSTTEPGPASPSVALSVAPCKLGSAKMVGLKDLLTTSKDKLNASAIQLQITAQSSLVSARRQSTHGHREGRHTRSAEADSTSDSHANTRKRARTAVA